MRRIFTLSESIRKSFRRRSYPRSGQQKGTIMVLTSVAMIGLLGMMALAIDLGYLFSSQTQIQNGINAAALAAGTGLRVTIEPDPKAPEQANIARAFAEKYATLNELRLLKFNKPSGEKEDDQSILANMEVSVDTTADIPSVRVLSSVPTPTLFAGAFGVGRVRIGAAATATLFPVEGGTGTIAAGSGAQSAGGSGPVCMTAT